MKKISILLFASLIAFVALSNTTVLIRWNTTSVDFGTIPLGEPVTHEFEFTNTGSEELRITTVQASCGCTVASFTKDPIAPGAKGNLTATYNAAKAGVFSKTLTVQSNAEENHVLTLKGTVIE